MQNIQYVVVKAAINITKVIDQTSDNIDKQALEWVLMLKVYENLHIKS